MNMYQELLPLAHKDSASKEFTARYYEEFYSGSQRNGKKEAAGSGMVRLKAREGRKGTKESSHTL